MIEPSPNRYLVRFSDASEMAHWASRQAVRLFDAGREGELDGSWSDHAVAGTIRVAYQPKYPGCSPYGTPKAVAESTVRSQIKKLRATADKMEKTLAAYGAESFIERPSPVSAPKHPFAYEPFLLSILRSEWTRIWVNGRQFVRDASRAAVRADIEGN